MNKDNTEFSIGFILGSLITFGITMFAWASYTHLIRKEAIKRNVATWVTDENGVTKFEWNQIKEETR